MNYIERHFCQFEKRKQASHEALDVWNQLSLVDTPEDQGVVYPRCWDYYSDAPSILLLGPPRSGKSTEFRYQSQKVSNGFLIELRDVDFEADDLTSVWNQEKHNAWKTFVSSEEHGELFIDSLDEGRLEIPQALKKVVRWIANLDQSLRNRLRIHLSCREFEWNRVDQDQWERLFFPIKKNTQDEKEKTVGFVKLAILPLGSSGISKHLSFKGIDEGVFHDSLPPSAEKLLRWPQSLQLVTELFLSDCSFGNIEELYRRVIEKRIQESNERRTMETQLTLSQRLNIARELAVISYLSGCETIALQQVENDKEVDAGLTGKSLDELRDVVNSELFESYTEGKVRFEDRGVAAFLAADYVSEALSGRMLSSGKLASLLYSDTSTREVVPFLRGMAGWLSVFSSDIRDILIQRSPSLFLSDDYLIDLTDNVKLGLWAWMKTEFGDREWFDDSPYEKNAGKLVCSEVVKDAQEVLRNKEMYGRDLRLFALSILSRGKIKESCDTILHVLFQADENEMVRRYALRALAKISPDKLGEVKPLLNDSSVADADLELLGRLLFELFPNYLTVDEILQWFDQEKNNNHLGVFQAFVRKVAEESDPDNRAVILDWLAQKLSLYLDAKKKSTGQAPSWLHTFTPALIFDDFLLPQLVAWGEKSDKYPQLEYWLNLLARASTYGLLSGHKISEIQEVLEANHTLRQQCAKLRIDRLFELKGDDFKPWDIHLHDRLYVSQAEDLLFWQETIVEWSDQPMNKVEAAWQEFMNCWNMLEGQTHVLDWLEEMSEKYVAINTLWERAKVCYATEEFMKGRWKRREEKRQKEQRIIDWVQAFRKDITEIEHGHESWIQNIVSQRFGEDKGVEGWLTEHVGEDGLKAFLKGLRVYWEASKPPQIEGYISNQVPSWSMVITMAVDRWLASGGLWSELDPELRQRAIRAGLWSLNEVPKWFFDAVYQEEEWAKVFFMDVLKLENSSDRDLIHLLHLFSGHGDDPFVRDLMTSFLFSEHLLREQMARQLLRLLCEKVEENPLDDCVLDRIWALALESLERGEQQLFLLYAATVFRFRQQTVWCEIEALYLNNEKREEHFENWLNTVGEVHLRFRMEAHWPAWINEESIASMIEDMFLSFPPEKDPGIKGFNNGQYHRSDMGRLRDEMLTILAESGSEFAGEVLESLLGKPWAIENKKSWVLHNIDIWKKNKADHSWVPVLPEDVTKLISQGADPIRSSDEFFNFVCNTLDDILYDIEKGEENIRTLLWESEKPKVESELQKLLARDFRKSMDAKKSNVISGRELDVAGNFPDIFATCILPSNKRARVFIEIKRQQHNDVVKSIENQLVDKYLSDADTQHGVYIVGWYGRDFYGSYKRKLETLNSGVRPTNAKDLETVLQLLADNVTAQRCRVEKIRVFVINLEKKKG